MKMRQPIFRPDQEICNYLKGTGLEVGLLMNFGKQKLEYKRMVL
ncbi:MAG: GxxExxY protein [Planctomycetota bacterium]